MSLDQRAAAGLQLRPIGDRRVAEDRREEAGRVRHDRVGQRRRQRGAGVDRRRRGRAGQVELQQRAGQGQRHLASTAAQHRDGERGCRLICDLLYVVTGRRRRGVPAAGPARPHQQHGRPEPAPAPSPALRPSMRIGDVALASARWSAGWPAAPWRHRAPGRHCRSARRRPAARRPRPPGVALRRGRLAVAWASSTLSNRRPAGRRRWSAALHADRRSRARPPRPADQLRQSLRRHRARPPFRSAGNLPALTGGLEGRAPSLTAPAATGSAPGG